MDETESGLPPGEQEETVPSSNTVPGAFNPYPGEGSNASTALPLENRSHKEGHNIIEIVEKMETTSSTEKLPDQTPSAFEFATKEKEMSTPMSSSFSDLVEGKQTSTSSPGEDPTKITLKGGNHDEKNTPESKPEAVVNPASSSSGDLVQAAKEELKAALDEAPPSPTKKLTIPAVFGTPSSSEEAPTLRSPTPKKFTVRTLPQTSQASLPPAFAAAASKSRGTTIKKNRPKPIPPPMNASVPASEEATPIQPPSPVTEPAPATEVATQPMMTESPQPAKPIEELSPTVDEVKEVVLTERKVPEPEEEEVTQVQNKVEETAAMESKAEAIFQVETAHTTQSDVTVQESVKTEPPQIAEAPVVPIRPASPTKKLAIPSAFVQTPEENNTSIQRPKKLAIPTAFSSKATDHPVGTEVAHPTPVEESVPMTTQVDTPATEPVVVSSPESSLEVKEDTQPAASEPVGETNLTPILTESLKPVTSTEPESVDEDKKEDKNRQQERIEIESKPKAAIQMEPLDAKADPLDAEQVATLEEATTSPNPSRTPAGEKDVFVAADLNHGEAATPQEIVTPVVPESKPSKQPQVRSASPTKKLAIPSAFAQTPSHEENSSIKRPNKLAIPSAFGQSKANETVAEKTTAETPTRKMSSPMSNTVSNNTPVDENVPGHLLEVSGEEPMDRQIADKNAESLVEDSQATSSNVSEAAATTVMVNLAKPAAQPMVEQMIAKVVVNHDKEGDGAAVPLRSNSADGTEAPTFPEEVVVGAAFQVENPVAEIQAAYTEKSESTTQQEQLLSAFKGKQAQEQDILDRPASPARKLAIPAAFSQAPSNDEKVPVAIPSLASKENKRPKKLVIPSTFGGSKANESEAKTSPATQTYKSAPSPPATSGTSEVTPGAVAADTAPVGISNIVEESKQTVNGEGTTDNEVSSDDVAAKGEVNAKPLVGESADVSNTDPVEATALKSDAAPDGEPRTADVLADLDGAHKHDDKHSSTEKEFPSQQPLVSTKKLAIPAAFSQSKPDAPVNQGTRPSSPAKKKLTVPAVFSPKPNTILQDGPNGVVRAQPRAKPLTAPIVFESDSKNMEKVSESNVLDRGSEVDKLAELGGDKPVDKQLDANIVELEVAAVPAQVKKLKIPNAFDGSASDIGAADSYSEIDVAAPLTPRRKLVIPATFSAKEVKEQGDATKTPTPPKKLAIPSLFSTDKEIPHNHATHEARGGPYDAIEPSVSNQEHIGAQVDESEQKEAAAKVAEQKEKERIRQEIARLEAEVKMAEAMASRASSSPAKENPLGDDITLDQNPDIVVLTETSGNMDEQISPDDRDVTKGFNVKAFAKNMESHEVPQSPKQSPEDLNISLNVKEFAKKMESHEDPHSPKHLPDDLNVTVGFGVKDKAKQLESPKGQSAVHVSHDEEPGRIPRVPVFSTEEADLSQSVPKELDPNDENPEAQPDAISEQPGEEGGEVHKAEPVAEGDPAGQAKVDPPGAAVPMEAQKDQMEELDPSKVMAQVEETPPTSPTSKATAKRDEQAIVEDRAQVEASNCACIIL